MWHTVAETLLRWSFSVDEPQVLTEQPFQESGRFRYKKVQNDKIIGKKRC